VKPKKPSAGVQKRQGPKIFENSRCGKSSSIVLEYVFFAILMSIALYSVATAKDIPGNTATLLRWLGIVVTFGVEGYKINERICDVRSGSSGVVLEE
jgi:hypothetical protein